MGIRINREMIHENPNFFSQSDSFPLDGGRLGWGCWETPKGTPPYFLPIKGKKSKLELTSAKEFSNGTRQHH